MEDLDRLEDITAIEDLNLSDNQIEDLKPLGQLENLIVLDLSKNWITDLSPLSGLARLNFLNLDQNQIESLEPLLAMPELVGLILTQTIDEVGPKRIPFSEHLTKIKMQISNHYPEYEKKTGEREGKTVESKSMEELRKENTKIKKACERVMTRLLLL